MSLRSKYPVSLSIVMPVFNEEKVIGCVVQDFLKISAYFQQAEFIIIDDKSTDTTPEILLSLKKKYPRLIVITNDKNLGHGPTLLKGYAYAKGKIVFHCDSDNQFQAKDFWLLWNDFKNYDCDGVIGYRVKRKDPFIRLLLAKCVKLLIFLLYGFWIRDAGSPFKLFKREALQKIIPPAIPDHAALPSVLMLIRAYMLHMNIRWVPVEHFPRRTDKSLIRTWKIFRLCIPAVKQIYSINKPHSRCL